MTHSTHSERGGFFAQPKAVWAVAFAAVVSFIAGHAPTHVVVLNPRAGALGRPVAA